MSAARARARGAPTRACCAGLVYVGRTVAATRARATASGASSSCRTARRRWRTRPSCCGPPSRMQAQRRSSPDLIMCTAPAIIPCDRARCRSPRASGRRAWQVKLLAAIAAKELHWPPASRTRRAACREARRVLARVHPRWRGHAHGSRDTCREYQQPPLRRNTSFPARRGLNMILKRFPSSFERLFCNPQYFSFVYLKNAIHSYEYE